MLFELSEVLADANRSMAQCKIPEKNRDIAGTSILDPSSPTHQMNNQGLRESCLQPGQTSTFHFFFFLQVVLIALANADRLLAFFLTVGKCVSMDI